MFKSGLMFPILFVFQEYTPGAVGKIRACLNYVSCQRRPDFSPTDLPMMAQKLSSKTYTLHGQQ